MWIVFEALSGTDHIDDYAPTTEANVPRGVIWWDSKTDHCYWLGYISTPRVGAAFDARQRYWMDGEIGDSKVHLQLCRWLDSDTVVGQQLVIFQSQEGAIFVARQSCQLPRLGFARRVDLGLVISLESHIGIAFYSIHIDHDFFLQRRRQVKCYFFCSPLHHSRGKLVMAPSACKRSLSSLSARFAKRKSRYIQWCLRAWWHRVQ